MDVLFSDFSLYLQIQKDMKRLLELLLVNKFENVFVQNGKLSVKRTIVETIWFKMANTIWSTSSGSKCFGFVHCHFDIFVFPLLSLDSSAYIFLLHNLPFFFKRYEHILENIN